MCHHLVRFLGSAVIQTIGLLQFTRLLSGGPDAGTVYLFTTTPGIIHHDYYCPLCLLVRVEQ